MQTIARLRNIILVSCAMICLLSSVVAEANVNPTQRILTSSQTNQKQEQQVLCLARNIYYEAGYENFDGKVAVAAVTLNRTKYVKFPQSICGVVSEKTYVHGKVYCQFNWICTHNKAIPVSSQNWTESVRIAKKILNEEMLVPGNLKTALYFHNTTVAPRWKKLTKVAKVGNHVFYADLSKLNEKRVQASKNTI